LAIETNQKIGSGTDNSIQASSKVSPGSAKTSRLRRSKRKEARKRQLSLLPYNNHPPQFHNPEEKTSSAKANVRTGWHPPQKKLRLPNRHKPRPSPAHSIPPYTIHSGLATAPIWTTPRSSRRRTRAWVDDIAERSSDWEEGVWANTKSRGKETTTMEAFGFRFFFLLFPSAQSHLLGGLFSCCFSSSAY